MNIQIVILPYNGILFGEKKKRSGLVIDTTPGTNLTKITSNERS